MSVILHMVTHLCVQLLSRELLKEQLLSFAHDLHLMHNNDLACLARGRTLPSGLSERKP